MPHSRIIDLLQARPSLQERVTSLSGVLGLPGVLPGSPGQPGASTGGYTPSGRGIFFNEQVDVLQPGDPRLVNVGGTTLARPAARSLRDVLRSLGIPVRGLSGGYRSAAEQQAAIDAGRPAAPVGSSFHQEGLAIDLPGFLQTAAVEAALARAGWRRFSPSGEPWHWSYGVVG